MTWARNAAWPISVTTAWWRRAAASAAAAAAAICRFLADFLDGYAAAARAAGDGWGGSGAGTLSTWGMTKYAA